MTRRASSGLAGSILAGGVSAVLVTVALNSHEELGAALRGPVAAPDSLEAIRPYADEVVCLATPEDFRAVGQFYRHFEQVEDEEVVALLARHRRKAPA